MRNHSLNCVRTRLVGVAVLATAILTRNCAVWAAALASDIHQSPLLLTISTVSTNAGNAGEATVHGKEQYASTKLAVSNSHGATTAEDPTSAVLFDYRSFDFDSLHTHLAESLGLVKKAIARGDTKPLRQRGRSRHADHHRKLQSACSSGDSFTVTSSLYPDAEGCYVGVSTSSGLLYYAGVYFYIAPLTLSTSSSVVETPGPAAAATPYPVTPSPVEVSTPAPEATRDPAAAPTVSPTPLTRDLPTSTSAPTEIRGDGDMSPAPVDIGPPDSGETPSPSSPTSGGVSCPVGEDFSIASPSVPDLEGCYYNVDATSSDLMLFSQTGTMDLGQYIVIDFGNDTTYWTIWYLESSTDTSMNITCFSSDPTIDAHPVDASWACDFDGTGDYGAVTASELSLECGCTMNITPAPIAQNPRSAPVADITPAPIAQNAPSASLNNANAARKADATVGFVCAVAGTIVSSALIIITGFIAS